MADEISVIDEKRILILDITKRLIAQYGYGKTTLDDIASGLGLKKSSLYYYYKNKEEIVYAMMMREKNIYLKLIKDALDITGSTHDKIIAYNKAKENYLKKAITPFDLTVNQFIEIKRSIKEIFKNIECDEKSLVVEVIENGVKKNELKKISKDKVAKAIINVSEAIRFKELYSSESQQMREVNFDLVLEQTEEIINLIFEGIMK